MTFKRTVTNKTSSERKRKRNENPDTLAESVTGINI